jgi:hypothetical protein
MSSNEKIPRYAVVERDGWGDTWQNASFDMASDYIFRGKLMECFRYIDREDENEYYKNFVIVRLRDDDTFTEADIVWQPYDEDSQELMRYNRRIGDQQLSQT